MIGWIRCFYLKQFCSVAIYSSSYADGNPFGRGSGARVVKKPIPSRANIYQHIQNSESTRGCCMFLWLWLPYQVLELLWILWALRVPASPNHDSYPQSSLMHVLSREASESLQDTFWKAFADCTKVLTLDNILDLFSTSFCTRFNSFFCFIHSKHVNGFGRVELVYIHTRYCHIIPRSADKHVNRKTSRFLSGSITMLPSPRYEPWMVHLYNTSENSAPFHCRYSTQKESLSACSSCESFVGPAWTGASTIWASVRSHVSVYLRLNNCLNYQINSLKVIIYSSQYKLAKILDVSGSEERNCEISTDSNYSVFTVHSHHCHPNVLHTLQKYVGASFRPYQRSSVPFSIRKALLSPASGDRYKLSWIHTHIHTRNQNSLDAKQSKMTFT